MPTSQLIPIDELPEEYPLIPIDELPEEDESIIYEEPLDTQIEQEIFNAAQQAGQKIQLGLPTSESEHALFSSLQRPLPAEPGAFPAKTKLTPWSMLGEPVAEPIAGFPTSEELLAQKREVPVTPTIQRPAPFEPSEPPSLIKPRKGTESQASSLVKRFGKKLVNSFAQIGETIISSPLSPIGVSKEAARPYRTQAQKELATSGFTGSPAQAEQLIETRAAQLAAGKMIPKFDVKPAKTIAEKGTDVAAGLTAFIGQLALTRKVLPKGTPEPVIWEVQNQLTGGVPGQGMAMRLALGGIGKIPVGSGKGKIAKVVLESGLFSGTTALMGGSKEDIIVAALIPPVFNAWHFTKQHHHLKNYEAGLKQAALKEYQIRIKKGMAEPVSRAHLKADQRIITNAVAKAKQKIYRDDAFAPTKEKWEVQRKKALRLIATGKPKKVQAGKDILSFIEKRPGAPSEPVTKQIQEVRQQAKTLRAEKFKIPKKTQIETKKVPTKPIVTPKAPEGIKVPPKAAEASEISLSEKPQLQPKIAEKPKPGEISPAEAKEVQVKPPEVQVPSAEAVTEGKGAVGTKLKEWSNRLGKIVEQRDANKLQLLADEIMKWRDDSGIGTSNKKLNFFIDQITDNLAAIRHLEARGRQARPAEKAPEVKEKEVQAGVGAAAFGFPSQNKAIKKAQNLALKNNKTWYVVQQTGGKFAAQASKPQKGYFTLVKPSGEAVYIKQSSLTKEESFDYGEHLKQKEKFRSDLDKFKARLREKQENVKALQNELFDMVNASGMSRAKVKSVVGILRNINTKQNMKTNVKYLMKAISKASDYTEQENRRTLRQAIVKELKKAKPVKTMQKILKGKYTPEVQKRLDFIRNNAALNRDSVLGRMQVNMQRFEKGDISHAEMLEANSLLNLVGIKGMSSKEMLNTLENIRLLRHQGKLVHDAKIEAVKERRVKTQNRILEILTDKKGLKKGTLSLPRDLTEKKAGWISKVVRANSAWDNYLDYLSRFDKSKPYESDLNKLGDIVHEAEHKETLGIEEYIQKINDGFKQIFDLKTNRQAARKLRDLGKKNIDLGTFKNADGVEVVLSNRSKEEIIKKYMETQDPTLEETFRGGIKEIEGEEGEPYGMRWTDKMLDAVRDNLTAKEKAWADWQLKFYQDYYNSVNKVYQKEFNIDLPHNLYYSPINRMAEQDKAEQLLLIEDVIRYASTTNPSLKVRVKNAVPLNWTSADSTLINHIIRMEHFKAWTGPISELRSVFNNKKTRKAIRQYHGADVLKHIDYALNQFARGGIDHVLVHNFVDKIRKNFTTAVLGVKPNIAFKQIPSLLAYTTEMPLTDFVKGVSKFWKNPISNFRMMKQLSPVFRERWGGGFERDIRFAMRKDYDKTIAHKENFRQWFFALIRTGDRLATAQGAYAKFLSERKAGKPVSEAMRSAEKSTNRTQPSYKLSTLATIQRSGSLWKLATMFMNQPNKYFRIASDNTRSFVYSRGSRLTALRNIALVWVVMPVLFEWIADAFQFKKEKMAVVAALGPFSYPLIAGQLIKNLALAGIGQAYGHKLSPIQTIPERFQRFIGYVRKIVGAGTDPTKDIKVDDLVKASETLAEASGYAVGIPTPYLVQAERAVRKAATKDIKELEKMSKERIGWRESPWAEMLYSPYVLKAEYPEKAMSIKELRIALFDNTTKAGYPKKGKEEKVKKLRAELKRKKAK